MRGQEIPKSHSKEQKENTDSLLDVTIYNEKAVDERARSFDGLWIQRWQKKGIKDGFFQSEESESPFSQYSSKGWKIHIVFAKGWEKDVARFLHKNGLYFKVEAGTGTFFNGLRESGATIYIGSYGNMQEIARLIDERLGRILQEGATVETPNKTIPMGSGSDIEIRPKITARFDVAKTKFGWLAGNKKYAEHGLPSWSTLGGIPVLKKYEKEIADITSKWNKFTPYQKEIYFEKRFKPIYAESRDELAKDFGSDFLFGGKNEEGA